MQSCKMDFLHFFEIAIFEALLCLWTTSLIHLWQENAISLALMFCNTQGKLCIIIQNSFHSLQKDSKGNKNTESSLIITHPSEWETPPDIRGPAPTKMISPSICKHTRTEALSMALHARCEIATSQLQPERQRKRQAVQGYCTTSALEFCNDKADSQD